MLNPNTRAESREPVDFYVRPATLQEALDLLNDSKYTSCILAGGTDLVNRLRSEGTSGCDRVVDVACLPELRGIRQVGGEIIIGAAVTHTEIVNSTLLQDKAPILVQACRQIGSPQIRNIATIGGNVVNAAACADTLPPLVCLDADAIVAEPGGEQRIALSDFVTGVYRTELPRGSLLRALAFTPPGGGCRSVFLRIGRRQAMSIARLSVAAMAVQETGGTISLIRLTAGAAFSRIKRISPVEEMLAGTRPSAGLVVEAGKRMVEVFLDESGGRWSAPYKEGAIAALTERALGEVLDL